MNRLLLRPYKWKLKWRRRKNVSTETKTVKRTDETDGEVEITLGVKRKGTNKVKSHNYTALNFFPKFLYLQFKQFANLLFLILSGIQAIPNISPFKWYTTGAPLIFIMSCSAIREIYEDIRRRVRDGQINDQKVWAYTGTKWALVKWKQIFVGQTIRLQGGDQVPADMLLLSSSEPGGVAYIETANLDGESNLKIRQSVHETSHLMTDEAVDAFWSTEGSSVVCERPNKNVHEFSGYLETSIVGSTEAEGGKATTNQQQPRKIPLNAGHLLLRGARLKNTDFAYGLVLYSGRDTKLMMNNTKRTMKRSLVTHVTNSIMCTQFGLCLLMVMTIAICHRCFSPIGWNLRVFGNANENPLVYTFLGCLMLMNGFVPISLYVTIEVVQVLQGLFIRQDSMMIDDTGKGADVKMFSLNSELGHVSYIMSDKTGTLTQNCMRFRQCSIGGIKYANKKHHRQEPFSPAKMLRQMKSDEKGNAIQIRAFLTACAVCHTVSPDKNREINKKPVYHATSPDESALVDFAAEAGFIFETRMGQKFTISVLGVMETYELLALIEFSSERKRMSVVVKDDMGNIRIFVKGADHMIFARLNECTQKLLKRTKGHLQNFATGGYRTLCFASRDISAEEWAEWEPKHRAASCLLQNRVQEIEKTAEMIEKDLELVGVSAIEDRLQDQVPETIEKMLRCGIRVWVLTGDKLETAVNIGNSCRLLSSRMPMLVIARPALADTQADLDRYIATIGEERLASGDLQLALVVDASCLDHLLSPALQIDFLRLALCCSAVICCRCTPIQKASVTRLVKDNVNGSVLAIGDGANDVAMIQEADVGVGISGHEGMQASLAADYAISQFCHLDRLLFVHGTLSLFRTSKCILYSIYKNVLETVILALFTAFNGMSDMSIADDWTVIRYNLMYTSWTALALGVMDRPVNLESFSKYPQMYTLYHNTLNFTSQLSWFVCAVVHAVTLFFTVILFFGSGGPLQSENGRESTLWVMGLMAYFCTVTVSNLKALLETNSITILSVAAGVASLLFLMLTAIWDSYMYFIPGGNYGLAHYDAQIPSFSLVLLIMLVVALTMIPDVTIKVIRGLFSVDMRDEIIWKEGRGPRLDRLYQPIFKICDFVGVRTALDEGRNGFAFAQDDGQVVTQSQLLLNSAKETERHSVSTSAKETGGHAVSTSAEQLNSSKETALPDRSIDDRTVENSSDPGSSRKMSLTKSIK